MGNVIGTDMTWYIYRRVLSTDEWVYAPLQCWTGIDNEQALKQFKHEVYTFALGKHVEYEDTKSIYLYRGSTRVGKALVDPDTRQVEVWSVSIREWLACEENLAHQRYPLHEKAFFSKFHNEHAWINALTVTFVRRE